MAVLEVIATTIAAKAGGAIWNTAEQALKDWQQGRILRQGNQLSLSISGDGRQSMVPVQNGVLQAAPYLTGQGAVLEPIYLGGAFYADPSFADFADDVLDYDEKEVLLFVFDEEMGDFVIGSFFFDGYSIALSPGLYSLYACIVDPILDEFLAIGYPMREHEQDPNPLRLYGSGPLRQDFLLFELDEEDWDDDDDDFVDLWDDDDDEWDD